MSAQSNQAPVIIKRKKIIADEGHHGGAWKVAYADFVTAMMAFFLLMWLLNATTEQQRKGIADYFSPAVPINRISGGGNGDFGGESVFSEKVLPQNGTGATSRHATEARQARGEMGIAEAGNDLNPAPDMRAAQPEIFEHLSEVLAGRSGESTVSRDVFRHIVTRVTDEGLIVEIFDLPDAVLFAHGTADPTPLMNSIVQLLVSAFGKVTNAIAVDGHTRAVPVPHVIQPAWDLSTQRANRTRLLLQGAGLRADRVTRITGHADRSPAMRDPMALRNNRIEVILLRSDR